MWCAPCHHAPPSPRPGGDSRRAHRSLCRGRPRHPNLGHHRTGARGIRGRRPPRRPGRLGLAGRGQPRRPAHPRRDDAQPRRAHLLPPPAGPRGPHPDPHADGPHRDPRPGVGPRCRRRRLPCQAVRHRRAPGPRPGAAAPCGLPHRAARGADRGGPARGRVRPAGLAQRARAGPHQDRVRPAPRAHPQRGHRAHALQPLRAGVAVRLRARLQDPRGLRELPAPQARAARRGAPAPHRPRCRLHAAAPS